MNEIGIVIVTFNGEKWISNLLESLKKNTMPYSVIVIDNGSKDKTTHIIKTLYPEVILLEQGENLGFGKANNKGIQIAIAGGVKYIFLLNQDTTVAQNCLSVLKHTCEQYPNFAIVSPLQLNGSGSQLEKYFTRFMAVDSDGNFFSDSILNKPKNAIYSTNFIQAAAWFIPKETFEIIGGFDPLFFHYGEDNNYCQRVLYHQMSIGVTPDTFICHDSDKLENKKIQPYTEPYYQKYFIKSLVKYANINEKVSPYFYKIERNKIIKNLVFDLLQFRLVDFKGNYKLLKIWKTLYRKIEKSRSINTQRGLHYLSIQEND